MFYQKAKILVNMLCTFGRFLSLLYFLQEAKDACEFTMLHVYLLIWNSRQTFFKLYMNILALEAPLPFFLRGWEWLNSCVKQLLTSIIPICLSTWNNWTSTGWIFVKFYNDKIHLWLISATSNIHFSWCPTQIHGF